MIPIRDTTPSRNVPVVNNILIAICVVVYFYQALQGQAINEFNYVYGLVPARYTDDRIAVYFTLSQQLFAWISFMFLHGSIWHLLGNMWFLYIFGDNVEDHLGPVRYLFFYLVCGIASGVSHVLFNLHSQVPTIGASGAIAGVMGAYFLLHPKSKILTLIPIIIIPWFVEIPAFVFLGLWFVLQFLSATVHSGAAGGIAWWAHIGGFLFGMLFLKIFERLPTLGVTAHVRKSTVKKRSHRLQVARPLQTEHDFNLHTTITISPYEALVGASKLVTVPAGFQRRLFRVNIPPGISADKVLRLRGQGRPKPDGSRGDILLRVVVH